MSGDVMIYAVAVLAFLAIAGVGMALAGGNGETAGKRARAIGAGGSGATQKGRGKTLDEAAKRRQKTQEMLENLRKRDKERRKSIAANDIRSRLDQAGLDIPVTTFWLMSVVCGIALGGVVYLSGLDGLTVSGISFKSKPVFIGAAVFVGVFGLPRVLLGIITKGRHKKLIDQFADALDVIVRGVKSGLPLNECVRIIALESPEPLRSEFMTLGDNLSMGTGFERALNMFYKRIPLPEVNFFVIVLMIQSKSGGNLSEALGNLSGVIRSRKMMREKIKAMSSEAKASAFIIGSLPFAVGMLVYVTTPSYMLELFRTETGHVILAMGGTLMGMGVMVMRNMINFEM